MWIAEPASTIDKLSFGEAVQLSLIVAGGLVVLGLVLMLTRRLVPDTSGGGVVRSWLAIGLVLGLLIFCAMTFAVTDTTLRSTVLGGLTASVGAVIAFYFSAKSGEQARKDLMEAHKDALNAAVGTETVPDLVAMTQAEAATTMSTMPLTLQVDPGKPPAGPTSTITGHNPKPGSTVPKGAGITVSF
jgi:predicted membrane-bound spermidine synthase